MILKTIKMLNITSFFSTPTSTSTSILKSTRLRSTGLSLVLLVSLFVPGLAAQADSLSSEDWQQFGLNTVQYHTLPAHQHFATQAQAFKTQTHAVCKERKGKRLTDSALNNKDLSDLQQGYKSMVLAWQGIQGIHFGPIEISMRHSAIQFWPDKKNHVGKRLATLLKESAKTPLDKTRFQKLPVSVRGLPAIERLLFSDDSLEQLQAQPEYCQVLTILAESMAETSQQLAQEWQHSMLPQYADPRQLDGYFEDEIDAATALLKTLVEPIEYNRDLKLKRPMGSQIETAKFKRLEFWRSELAHASLEQNLRSALAFYELEPSKQHSLKSLMSKSGKETEVSNIDQAFQAALQTLDDIPTPMEDSINTEAGYKAINQHIQALTALHTELENGVSKLGIHLGFNSRDGD